MSLSTRLSLFFLAALAVVLLGFSSTLYLLGRSYLTNQLDERLEKALDTLEAAVDIETDGLEWEPRDRRLTLGVENGVEQVRWTVHDGAGGVVDRSPNLVNEPFPPHIDPEALPEMPIDGTSMTDVPGWRIARRHLRLTELLNLGRGHPENDSDDDIEYPELVLTAGLSPFPTEASLYRLALALGGVSAAVLLLSAVLGRWLCQRALAPIVQMAAAAREKAASNDQSGLPSPGTGDELEDLGKAFNALLDRRREALERQQRFTGDASHQLRTPVAGLLSLVEVVRRRPRPAEEYEQTLDQVHREANRLRQIVDSLLFLARTETESEPLKEEPLDLTVWTPETLKRWAEHPRAVDLHYEGADHGVWARAHAPLLAQALENLVDNALKYSEPGSAVRVRVWREPGVSCLAVEDRGCGLSLEETAAVFEPFYRSPRARLMGRCGVGLGLSVVHRIVAASRGSIQVEGRPGQGARFTVRLPEVAPKPYPDFPPLAPAEETTGYLSPTARSIRV
ncbi:sensor histidine kinase [Paludisphaera borealis]|uniref:histidine kinase n=1 Tax=Paludisphaera borealis TaxID=1387353 RepID=A0A1U7CL00_9BACT|nr:HAMP domain-containing sensor histidine kinase [Paludisphaera borealis]APW59587.1 putative sensor histidine kinase TcrY [Paludisphaera borealis]